MPAALGWIFKFMLMPLFAKWIADIEKDAQKKALFDALKEQYASDDKAVRKAARRALAKL